MASSEPGPSAAPARILVSAETLFAHGVDGPQPLSDASAAIERLGWIGQPVLIVGERIAGRRLPADPADRIGWVRARLGSPDVAAAVFDEPVVDLPGAAAEQAAARSWDVLGRSWRADRLVTSSDAAVGPARRAGLTVVRVGPRDPAPSPLTERADHEARDLLDAVRRLMAADVFGGAPGDRARPPDLR